MNKILHGGFFEKLDEFGISKRTAVICNGNSFSYEDMRQRIEEISAFLLAAGIVKGNVVAVLEDMSDQPMVFVGSSFGAIVAYEISCRLKRPPEALLVIGSRTPDPENMRFTYHQMSDDMLNTQLKAMGSPEKEVLVIDNTLLRSAKDALRAVSQLAESYTSTSKLLTGCKVISIWPQEDTTVSCRQQQSWENLVPSDLYEFHSIKGGHRVLLDDPKEIFTIANVSSLVEVLVADR